MFWVLLPFSPWDFHTALYLQHVCRVLWYRPECYTCPTVRIVQWKPIYVLQIPGYLKKGNERNVQWQIIFWCCIIKLGAYTHFNTNTEIILIYEKNSHHMDMKIESQNVLKFISYGYEIFKYDLGKQQNWQIFQWYIKTVK